LTGIGYGILWSKGFLNDCIKDRRFGFLRDIIVPLVENLKTLPP